MLRLRVVPPPAVVERIHQVTAIARNGNFPPARAQNLSNLPMLRLVHLKAVSLAVPTGGVKIRRIAVASHPLFPYIMPGKGLSRGWAAQVEKARNLLPLFLKAG
ncbi:MAG: hypothetical protein HYX94_10730 [Chloroflexi bacterium]|nr:hypothetical protein [Chloroflexota bacterium]